MAVQPWGQQGAGYGGKAPQPPAGAFGPAPQWPAAPQGGSVPEAMPQQLPQAAMRAAHTDRDRTVDVLKAAYAEGRLSSEEYSQRFDAASRAQTYGELARIVADLPAGPMVAPMAQPAPAMPVMPVMPVPVVPATFLMPPPPPPPPTNGVAAASLVLGLMTIVTAGATGLPAVITGHIAKNQLRTRNESGDGMATTGLILGYLSIAGWGLLILMGLLAAVSSGA